MDEVHRSCCRYAVTVENVTHIFVFLLSIMIFLIYFFVPHPFGKIDTSRTEKIWGGGLLLPELYSEHELQLCCGRYIPAPMLGWPLACVPVSAIIPRI